MNDEVHFLGSQEQDGKIKMDFQWVCLTLRLWYFVTSPVSEFVNHAAWLVISVMDGIVSLGTLIPNIDLQNRAFLSEWSYATLFAYFSSIIWLHCNPERMKTHQIWLPVIILLISIGLILLFNQISCLSSCLLPVLRQTS